MTQSSLNPTVFIRFSSEKRRDGPENESEKGSQHTTSNTVWTSERLAAIKDVLKWVKFENERFVIDYNFEQLSKSIDVDKPDIYRKIIELYHVGEQNDKTTAIPGPQQQNHTVPAHRKSLNGVHPALSMYEKSNSTIATVNSGTMKRSLLERLELLKLGNGSSATTSSGGATRGAELAASVTNEPYSFPAEREGASLGVAVSGTGGSSEDEDSENSSLGSLINMASASVYMHRSKLVSNLRRTSKGGRSLSDGANVRRTDDRDESEQASEEGVDQVQDFLLTGTTNSLSNSLLEQELLDRI